MVETPKVRVDQIFNELSAPNLAHYITVPMMPQMTRNVSRLRDIRNDWSETWEIFWNRIGLPNAFLAKPRGINEPARSKTLQ